MKNLLLVGFFSVLLSGVVSSPACPPTTFTYEKGIVDANSTVDMKSSDCYLDGPKVRPINETTWDWWYFDTVSEDLEYALSVQFLATPGTALYASQFPPDQILGVVVQLVTPHGAFVYGAAATGASVVTNGQGASGLWQESGMSFTGSPDLKLHAVNVDNEDIGLKATMTMISTAPPHYPGGPAVAGMSMEVIPGIGWANAVPDGNGSVKVQVNGTEIQFTGSAYHDKNWGDSPFVERLKAWYWGHGRVGPYTLVWFQSVSPSGEETFSSYVAKDGNILLASAADDQLVVRPIGDFQYPPLPGDHPSGYTIKVNMGCKGVFEAKVVATQVGYEGLDGTHTRWIGTISGGLKGGPVYTGTSYYEQFAL